MHDDDPSSFRPRCAWADQIGTSDSTVREVEKDFAICKQIAKHLRSDTINANVDFDAMVNPDLRTNPIDLEQC